MIARALVAVGFTVAGLLGLYFQVEYSGWVLFIGLFAGWSLA